MSDDAPRWRSVSNLLTAVVMTTMAVTMLWHVRRLDRSQPLLPDPERVALSPHVLRDTSETELAEYDPDAWVGPWRFVEFQPHGDRIYVDGRDWRAGCGICFRRQHQMWQYRYTGDPQTQVELGTADEVYHQQQQAR